MAMEVFAGIAVGFAILASVFSGPSAEERRRRENLRNQQRERPSVPYQPPQYTPYRTNRYNFASASSSATPTQSLTCRICYEEIPSWSLQLSQSIGSSFINTAACQHHWCFSCLADLFERSLADQSLFPPSCCSKLPFPEGQLIALNVLSKNNYNLYISKLEEFSTTNPFYCPQPSCSAFISPTTYKNNGTAAVTCTTCGTRACPKCRSSYHYGACKVDTDLTKVLNLVKDEMWKRCPGCQAVVELRSGCNHVTCRCKKEFCYVCGGDWRAPNGQTLCSCPLWSEVRASRQMQIPLRQPQDRETRRIEAARILQETLRAERQAEDRRDAERREVERRERVRELEVVRRELARRELARQELIRQEAERREVEEREARMREARLEAERWKAERREEGRIRRRAAIAQAQQTRVKEQYNEFLQGTEESQEQQQQTRLPRVQGRMNFTAESSRHNHHPPNLVSAYKPRRPRVHRHGINNGKTEEEGTDQTACRHRKFWPKVEGRHHCTTCSKTFHSFILQCPDCQIMACVPCKKTLR